MAAGIYNITIEQGSDWAMQIVVKDDGVVRNLTGYSARAQIRPRKTSSTLTGTMTCSITLPETGAIRLQIANAVSKLLTPGTYYWDLEIYTANDAIVNKILKGKAEVDAEVTR